MKIIYISASLIPSRYANSIHVMKMCAAFANEGHEVVLLAPQQARAVRNREMVDVYSYYGVASNFNIKRFCFPRNFFGRWIYAFLCLAAVLKLKPDLVYGRFLSGCFLTSLSGIGTIFETHSPIAEYGKLSRVLIKTLINFKSCRRMVVISDALREILQKQGLRGQKIFVAHDGADDLPSSDIVEGFGENRINVGYIGHLYKGRGIEVIVEMARALPDFAFHCIGGTERDIGLWKEQGTENLLFHGHVPPAEVPKYRNSCDILVAPYQRSVQTLNGGNTAAYMSPLKIFEYMASKKTIICSDLPVIREVLNHHNSILVDPENVAGWITAVIDLKDEKKRKVYAETAYCDFISNFTWKKRAARVLAGIAE